MVPSEPPFELPKPAAGVGGTFCVPLVCTTSYQSTSGFAFTSKMPDATAE